MINLSHSSMSSWRRCRARYYWEYIAGFSPPSSAGQRKGSVGHASLAEWYKTGDEDKAIQVASDKLFEYEQKESADLSEEWYLIAEVLKRYFEWSRNNDRFKVLEVEQKYVFQIGDSKVVSIIDGIVEDVGGIWLLEHKFLSRVNLSNIDLDPQLSMYFLAAKKMGYKVAGALYNVIRMGDKGIALTDPVVRRPVYRNPEGLAVIEMELERQALEMTRVHEKEDIPIYRNPTKDCTWDCGFYKVCLSLSYDGTSTEVLSTYDIYHREEIKE